MQEVGQPGLFSGENPGPTIRASSGAKIHATAVRAAMPRAAHQNTAEKNRQPSASSSSNRLESKGISVIEI